MWSPLGPATTAPLQTAHCQDKDGCPGTRTAVWGWQCRISGPNDTANRFMAPERKSPSLNQVTPQLTPRSCKELWGVLHLKHESSSIQGCEERDPPPQLSQRAEHQPHTSALWRHGASSGTSHPKAAKAQIWRDLQRSPAGTAFCYGCRSNT